MPGTEVARKQHTLGGAAGIALLAFALAYRFFPGVLHLQPLPEPIADLDLIAQFQVRRRDRLGGLLHEYEHAA